MAGIQPLKTIQRRKKTLTTLQMEHVECGAACLAMILGYYNKHIKLSQLRQDCGVSRDGVKASNIVQAARRYGLKAAGYNKSCEELQQLRAPAILFWDFNHFVILEGFNARGAFINDPSVGHRLVTHEDFSKSYTGVVLEFEPAPEFEPEGRPFAILPGLIRRCREHPSVLVFLVIVSVLNVLPILVLAASTSVFTDRILSGTDQTLFHPVIATVAIAAGFIIVLTYVYHYYLRRLHIGLTISLSTNFTYHLLHLPTHYFQQRSAGEVISRERLNDNVADVISQGIVQFVNDLVNMLVFCSVMFLLSVKLTLTAIALTLPLYLYIRWSASSRIEASMAVAMEGGKASGIAIEGVSSIEAHKAGGQESAFFARWASAFSRATEKSQQLSVANLLPQVVTDTLTQSSAVVIVLLGAWEIMNGRLSLGEVIAFQILMIGFTGPLEGLSKFYSKFQQLQGELERLDDVLDHPQDARFLSSSDRKAPNPDALAGHLKLTNISFRYSPVDVPFVEQLTVSINPGQRVALVGASGSGKSTVAKLAAGIYTPEHGQVELDGYPLSEWQPSVLAQAVAMVSQESFLIEGTVRDNLTLWDPTVPEHKIIAACQDAEIWQCITALPDKLSALMAEEGANFSGGERQRLQIARALIHEPILLILDEATSALDPATERKINQNLQLRGCTCLIVAHRLSTVQDCDNIIVLSDGLLLESGTHEQLWQADGEYRQLYTSDETELI